MIVIKFGGSSLCTAGRITRCARIVLEQVEKEPVVVVSALGKTTDRLVSAAKGALEGGVHMEEIEEFHLGIAEDLSLDRSIIENLLYRLQMLLHGISIIRELTPRTMDSVMSFGERLSSLIFSQALSAEGAAAVQVNAWDLGLVTTPGHGGAVPLEGCGETIRKEIEKLKLVPVVTGFLGKDAEGHITTLGRSGSDFSASIIGAAVDAAEVQIWSDVDGVMSCDPSICTEARNLPVLSFAEAGELAYYGAKVLHPNTLVPAIEKNIPVRVMNTLNPENAGTKIVNEPVISESIAKAVVYRENVCLINLSWPRLASAVRLLSDAFNLLSRHSVGIHMATTSEATVSMVTDRAYSEKELEAPLKELRSLGHVELEREKAIICVVGEELKGKAGVISGIFSAVASHGIKARMASQSGSEINVAFLVDNAGIEPSVKALHELLVG